MLTTWVRGISWARRPVFKSSGQFRSFVFRILPGLVPATASMLFTYNARDMYDGPPGDSVEL